MDRIFGCASFVGYVSELLEHDLQAKSRLASAITTNPGMEIAILGIIEPYMPGGAWPSEHVRRCSYVVAMLMAMAPRACNNGNMGTHLGQLANRNRSSQPTIERDLIAILDKGAMRLEDLCPRLASIVRRLEREDIPVNYIHLLEDLIDWRWSSPARSWGLSYYQARFRRMSSEEESEESESEKPKQARVGGEENAQPQT